MSTAAGVRRWVSGPWYDGFFFLFGATFLAALVGGVLVWEPRLLVPVWLAWLCLVEGPHLVATWSRAYLDPVLRRQHGAVLYSSFLWLVPGLFAWAILHTSGLRAPFELFLGAAALWSWHHTVRQDWGILAIYHRLDGTPSPWRRLDKLLLHAGLWLMLGLSLLWHPENRGVLGLPEAGAVESLVVLAGGVVVAAVFVGYAVACVLRRRQALRAPVVVLVSSAGKIAFSLFIIGAHEPLLPGATGPEQLFLAAGLVGGMVHGLQYLGLHAAVGKRRYALLGGSHVAARLGKAPLVAYGLMAVVSLGYVALNVVRGVLPDVTWVSPGGAELALAFYWGLFFHHYWLDQKIWKVSGSPMLQYELGLRDGAGLS